jgi:hypothetical protein
VFAFFLLFPLGTAAVNTERLFPAGASLYDVESDGREMVLGAGGARMRRRPYPNG